MERNTDVHITLMSHIHPSMVHPSVFHPKVLASEADSNLEWRTVIRNVRLVGTGPERQTFW